MITASKISIHRIENSCVSLSTCLSFWVLIPESPHKAAFSFLRHVLTTLMFKRLSLRLFLSHRVSQFNCCCDRVRDLPRRLGLQLGYNNIISIPETLHNLYTNTPTSPGSHQNNLENKSFLWEPGDLFKEQHQWNDWKIFFFLISVMSFRLYRSSCSWPAYLPKKWNWCGLSHMPWLIWAFKTNHWPHLYGIS